MSRKLLYITIGLLLLLAGIYAGLKDWTGRPENAFASKVATVVNVSGLMKAANIFPSADFRKAPDFDLLSLDGRSVQLSQYRGKVVLISFWTTW
ncbi:MAG TPA: redoxin domain-containing protein [Nitrospirae bacterium]|nr:thiol-disulfide oxidoreductase [bacterium BMS3Abin08]HDO35314.1 redoxin domain-containing protein [Nitrospirota bacterium]